MNENKNLPELIVIDNFIEDEELLNKIDNDEAFWEEGYSWWGGWWNSPANSTRHELIEYIWKYKRAPINAMSLQGFEHWIGVNCSCCRGPDGEGAKEVGYDTWALPPHFDKDEKWWQDHPQGKDRGSHPDSIINPIIGTIFYTSDVEEGGYLKIFDTDHGEVNFEKPFELIKPKRNRLVVFNAGKLHGVLEVKKGLRKAIAINLWDKKPTTEFKEDY